jgi:hypothetical protein
MFDFHFFSSEHTTRTNRDPPATPRAGARVKKEGNRGMPEVVFDSSHSCQEKHSEPLIGLKWRLTRETLGITAQCSVLQVSFYM